MNTTSQRKHVPNPSRNANIISKTLHWWTADLFRKGYNNQLTFDDIYSPLEEDEAKVLGDRLEGNWIKQLDNAKENERKPSFFKALYLTFRKGYIIISVFASVEVFVTSMSPLLLGVMLGCFEPNSKTSNLNSSLLALVLVFGDLSKHVMQNHINYNSYILGNKMRAAVSSVIYRKALRSSAGALSEISSGKIMNFMANDVSRFEFFIRSSVYSWSTPLSLAIVGCVLYLKSGNASFIGIAGIFILIPLEAILENVSVKYRLRASTKSGERLRLINGIISGIQVIKMYVWEKPFSTLVENARKIECQILYKSSIARDIHFAFNIFSPRVALYLIIIGMFQFGKPASSQNVFVIIPFIVALTDKLFIAIKGCSDFKDFWTSLERMQSYLILPECDNLKDKDDSIESGCINKSFHASHAESLNREDVFQITEINWSVTLENVTMSWKNDLSVNVLEDVNLNFEEGKLYIVIGMVGSGKSSLLSSILGEVYKVRGKIEYKGKLSYASQEAWIFGGTIRQNILFGEDFEQQRYDRTVEVCCLLRDFERFPLRDLTIVGEKGVSLSGGQKARINLARAVYKKSDIYLLDDPLSAVDAHVGKQLFESCIVDYLQNKTRILVTHQVQYIKDVDGIILVEHRQTRFYSNYIELIENYPEYRNLIAMQKNEDSEDEHVVEKKISNNDVNDQSNQKIKVDDGQSADIDDKETKIYDKKNLLLLFYTFGSHSVFVILMIGLFILTEISIIIFDFYIIKITDEEDNRLSHINKTRKQQYSDESTIEKLLNHHVIFYTISMLMVVIIGLSRSYIFSLLSSRSSMKLHNEAFNALMKTKLKFFHDNASGMITDRFSKDIAVIDELLPRYFIEGIQIMSMTAGAVIIVFIIDITSIVPALIIISICVWMYRVFIRTSNIMRRLQGMARAPVFTYLSETIDGIQTIRAYGAEKTLLNEFDNLLDKFSGIWFCYASSKFAVSLSVRLLTSVFTTSVLFVFIFYKEHFTASQVGLAITQIFCFTGFASYAAVLLTDVVDFSSSIERLLRYTKLPIENEKEPKVMNFKPANTTCIFGKFMTLTWPRDGCIEFQHVFLRYERDNPVLKDLNFKILSKEKVGIVGRTGAGKSSLITALFRLADIEGSIKIDGIDTGTISLETLRSNISIIPQDPVLFSGSLRRNLDPFDEFSDDDIWNALDKVELRSILSLSNNGLESQVSDNGSNYSVGQKQLVCLARAVLRRNCILILDEATANVDPQTDVLIQKTIRTEFLRCTVLTVAHRLNTIIDSDRVMVMDNGYLVEFDHPFNLLKERSNKFTELVEETGKDMYEKLFVEARQSFNKRNFEL